MNSCHKLPPHTWSKAASLSRKVSSSHPFVLLFIHPCCHGVQSGASQLPLSHLPFIKSLLKPFLAYHPSTPTWPASARPAATSIISFSPVHLLPPRRRQPLMTPWVRIHLLLPPTVDQTSLAYLRSMKSPSSLRWWTTALTSLSPLMTLIDCLHPKFKDLKTNYFHLLFHLQHGLPLLSSSNTFMNNLTLTWPHNRRTGSSMPLLPSSWAPPTIRTPDMLSTPILLAAIPPLMVICMHVDYSTIYIPCGHGHPWAGPSEWGPLMVFLAAALLWPDLPFLVCHPRFLLGAHAPLDELREVFSTNCPMVLFSSARDLTRSDVLYHPGKTTKFAHDPPFSCSDPPFTRNPPDLVQNLISSSVNAHAAAAPANRERLERLASPSIEADLHFPLLCTPYYGFVPETEVDLFVEILQLSSFLCSCCFANDGNDIPHLGDSAPTAAALLSTLSAIPNERSGGSIAAFPGTGVFICDPAPAPQNGDPAIACWLYIPASLPPPPPTVFCTLIATLSPSDPRFATPLFETYSTAPGSRTGIPLGSHVCVHLNASLLPTPFLGQSEPLQYLPVARGGLGPLNTFTLSPLLANKNPCPPSR